MEILNYENFVNESIIPVLDVVIDDNGNVYNGDKGFKLMKGHVEKSGSKIIYNKCRLQKLLKDVNTCGRHCAIRAKFNDMSLSKYCKMLKDNKCYDPDLWVTALTITYSL